MYGLEIGERSMKNKSSLRCNAKLDVAWIAVFLSVTRAARWEI
jgi:hypothetical protein